MSVNFRLEGLDEVKSKLERLANSKKAKSIARKAARQAMNIVRDSARTNAKTLDDPETAEKIWKNITVSGGKSRNPNNVVMRVGVDGGASVNKDSRTIVLKSRRKKGEPPQRLGVNTISLSGGDTRHWRFIEFGTSTQPAVPFMRPALELNIQNVTNKFAAVFNAELDKELAS